MRIAYVCADQGVPVYGRKGCSLHVQEVIRGLLALGHDVELFAPNVGGDVPAGLDGVRLHRLPSIPKHDAPARERAAWAANDEIARILDRAGPFALIYERHALWSYAAMEYARARHVPGVLEVNAPLIDEQQRFRTLADPELARRAAERSFAAADALVAVSAGVAGYLGRFLGSDRKVHVVPNGVDPSRFAGEPTATRPAPLGTFTVGFVGSLKPWHGLDTLVKATALLSWHHRDVRLLVVGDGPERPGLEQQVREWGLVGNLELTGAVAPEAIPGLLASMDVAVAPYPADPNFYFSPLKVYEYMAAGRPVVASWIGQLDELIEDGVTGLLCPPGDPWCLANALDKLRRDPLLRFRLGDAARAKAIAHHSWAAAVQRILTIARRFAAAEAA